MIVAGILTGLKHGGNLDEAAQEEFKDILETTRSMFGIASPSKVMKQIGSYISEGLGLGIKGGSKEAIKAAGDMCDKVVDSMDGLKDASKAGKTYEKAMEGVADSSKGLAKAVGGSTDGLGDGFDDAKKSAKKFGDTAENAGDQAEKAGNKKISFGGAFAIAVTIIGALVEFFKNLMESNEEFGAKVDEVCIFSF